MTRREEAAALRETGLSHSWIAKRMGVSRGYISSTLRAHDKPEAARMEQMKYLRNKRRKAGAMPEAEYRRRNADRNRRVVELLATGREYSKVAELCGITRGTVAGIVSRAKKPKGKPHAVEG